MSKTKTTKRSTRATLMGVLFLFVASQQLTAGPESKGRSDNGLAH